MMTTPVSVWIFTFILGLLLGSFISMLTWRLPRIQTLSSMEQWRAISLGRSKCPHCQSPLAWYHLIPVVSWLASLGRCQQCQQPISIRYPLIELASASLMLLALYHFGLNEQTLWTALLFLTLLTITIIDLEHQLILDNLSLPLLWLGLILNAFSIFTTADLAILGAAFGYLSLWLVFHIYRLMTGKAGMGYGDFKLFAAIGAWLGIYALPQVILIASFAGLVVAISLMIIGKHQWQTKMAFGPFLALSAIATLVLGDQWLIENLFNLWP